MRNYKSRKSAKKFMYKMSPEFMTMLLSLKKADDEASMWPKRDFDYEKVIDWLNEAHSENKPSNVAKLAISGNDIISGC